jgi:F-type H+-transporting ATPase subunit epsilon
MKLRVLLPTRVLLDEEVTKVTAEAENGMFGILPRHVDFVTILVPGIVSFEINGKEEFLAVDEGVLVKQGEHLLVSVRDAVRSESLGTLRQTINKQFLKLDEQERKARSVIARFEADFARRFLEMEGYE